MTEKEIRAIEHMTDKVVELKNRSNRGFQLEGNAIWVNRKAYEVFLEWAIEKANPDPGLTPGAVAAFNDIPIIVVDPVPLNGTMFYVGTAAEVQGFINYIAFERRN